MRDLVGWLERLGAIGVLIGLGVLVESGGHPFLATWCHILALIGCVLSFLLTRSPT